MAKRDSELQHIITLVAGDWSQDGHSRTETTVIRSNMTLKQVEAAYGLGSKIVGFDLTADVACEYDDNYLFAEHADKLKERGFKLEKFIDVKHDFSPEVGGYSIWSDTFIEIWLFIVKLGEPDFRYKVTDPDVAQINIGGYGLFSS